MGKIATMPRMLAALFVCVAQLVLLQSHTAAAAGNKFPIILVHGIVGYGREELGGGLKYWGGFDGDWQEKLKTQGFDVRTAVVGPFSSNWDRACELYAFIKGGTVHYGANHARTHKHNVTGRTFPGIFPQWGDVVNGEVQKIHLVGHSQGGQTARMLAQLLTHGSKGAPIEEDATSHPLFAGGHDWIHSITTLSTPNQGTTLGSAVTTFGEAVVQLVAGVAGLLSSDKDDGSPLFYDAKLDQFGLGRRQKSESVGKYVRRVLASSIFHDSTTDNCLYSLATTGALRENAWVETLPSIYYYSFSVRDTFDLGGFIVKKVALPKPTMFLLLQPFAVVIGSRYTVDTLGYSDAWLANDGAVNTASMVSDGKGAVVEYKSVSKPGRWHHVALLDNVDHQGVVGTNPLQNVFNVYAAHAALLANLPATATATATGKRALRGAAAMGEHVATDAIVRSLRDAVAEANAYNHVDAVTARCAEIVRSGDVGDQHAAVLASCARYLEPVASGDSVSGGAQA